MKKIISLILLSVFVLLFTACTGAETAPSEAIVGTWKYSLNQDYRDLITGIISDDRVYVDVFYEFYADKSGCTYSTNDGGEDKISFTYDLADNTLTLTMGDNSFSTECRIDGDSMTIVENGDTVVFKKIKN